MADDLLRVVAVGGALVPDPRRRLPGRGAWVHLLPECLTRAERRSAFPRALRAPGPLDVDRVRSYLLDGTAPRCPVPREAPHHRGHGTTRGHSTTREHQPTVIEARELPGSDNHESKVDPS